MVAILDACNVSLSRDGVDILNNVSWRIEPGERWIVIGPNGAGKTTLLELVSDWDLPVSGSITVLGDDTRTEDSEWIRPRIGIASAGMAKRIPATETVRNAVVTAAYALSERGETTIEDVDIRRATRVLGEWGLEAHADRTLGSLSEGELKRVQLARAIMTDPEIILFDEPTAGLDLGAREELLMMLGSYASAPQAPTMVMVTHHVEEIPRGFSHALIMRAGTVVAAGPIESTLTSDVLSQAYGLPIEVTVHDGRYSARAHINF